MPSAPVPLRFSETARSGTRMLMALPVTIEPGKGYQTVVALAAAGCAFRQVG